MEVSIVGFNTEQSAELEEAVEFFAKILFHGNLRNRLQFVIERSPLSELHGECWPEDVANRMFVVTIRGDEGDDDPVSTLAHEMVHAKQ